MKSLLLVGMLGLGGCYSVAARVAPGVNVAQYRTFSFYPEKSDEQKMTLDTSPAGQAVRDQVRAQLLARGLREDPSNPDFLVAYHMKTREVLDVVGWGYGPGWGWDGWYGPWYGPGGYMYTEGTVIIDFVDPHTNQAFWRGTATSTVSQPDNPNPAKTAKAVDKIMRKYPVNFAAVPQTHM